MKTLSKKTLLILAMTIILVAGTTKTYAQLAEFGLRFMPTYTNLNLQSSDGGTVSGEVTLGYGFGALLGLNLSDHVGIQGEIIYNTYSQQYVDQDIKTTVTLQYINIPLLISFNTGKNNTVNFNGVIGPQIGINVGSSLSGEGDNGTADDPILSVNKGDLGFAYGAGFDFALNKEKNIRAGMGFRGVYGLFDISDDSQTTSTDEYYVLDRTNLKTYSVYVGLSILL